MTLIEFFNVLEKYSVNVLALALGVCIATSLIKKAVPASYKKYLTFIPFILGCIAYAIYMFICDNSYNVFSSLTVEKGFECGAASTIYYIVYEQFIRGKKSLTDNSDYKQLAVEEILKDFVKEDAIESVSKYLAENVSLSISDNAYCLTLCTNALNGKTLSGVTEDDISLMSKLIVKTLSALK